MWGTFTTFFGVISVQRICKSKINVINIIAIITIIVNAKIIDSVVNLVNNNTCIMAVLINKLIFVSYKFANI